MERFLQWLGVGLGLSLSVGVGIGSGCSAGGGSNDGGRRIWRGGLDEWKWQHGQYGTKLVE